MYKAISHPDVEEMTGICSASGAPPHLTIWLLFEKRNKGNFVSFMQHIAMRDMVS